MNAVAIMPSFGAVTLLTVIQLYAHIITDLLDRLRTLESDAVSWSDERTLHLQEGDFVAFGKQTNGVLIKLRVVDPDDMLTPAEAKKLRHGLKQIREGKTRPWSQIKHELGL